MSISAPNFTQIPNVVFDYWMPRLSLAAQSILFAICRKTFGWHKTTDTISKNQLIKCTGISKNTIQKAIEELESFELLIKHSHQNEYGHQPNTYSLNVDKPDDPNLHDEGQNLGGGRSNSDLGVGQILTPQKKDIQNKEREREGFGDFVKFSKEEYANLCNLHTKEKTDDIIQLMNDHCINNRPKGYPSYTCAFRTFLRNYKSPKAGTNLPLSKQTNKEFVEKFFKDGCDYNNHRCDITPTSIMFHCGSQTYSLLFDSNGFNDQLKGLLEKRGIKVKIT
jgi:phage replication O-like protein O